ncbi:MULTISPECIES: MFS transporter [unclassified Paracoccus (in: a-proteobacteria)]|uniref:MFS transporter n=1 Tax=unclassified Paracoccus (in: a-proteobacteria) TaxID=2688777 RepID=UPI0012B35649|nr:MULTISPECIES: MFS transporter [unclassified Paracoccus (in: a-proteobacteria)]UXU76112.1 MFS transporter [Paracoccus sp. SMMA_5]UXU82024.1 MFS transporter [Paracoccus sp. SMMA_5_TC]
MSPPPRKSPFAPFRHADFRLLWSATLISNFGGLVQSVGAAWMMTQLTDSATLIALVQASNALPIMIFALISGALADNLDRRTLLLGAQTFMAVVSLLLAVLTWQGWMTPVLLLTLTFLIGVGQAIYNPPWQASMQDLVPREELPAAVTLNSVGFNLMRSVGPAAGGIITAIFGAAAAFAVNAVSYLPLLGALLRWHPVTPARLTTPEPFVAAVGAGLRYVALSPNLVRVLTRGALFGFSAVVVLALLPLVAKENPQGGSLLFGLLLGCFGLGAIGGAMINPRVRERFDNENVVRIAFAAFAGSALLLGLTDSTWLHALAMLPAGASWVLALSLFNVTVQLSTPRWVVARALALYQTATFGGMALGSWTWGAIASAHGVSAAITAAALPLALGAVLGHWLRIPEFGTLDLDPANRFREPPLALDLRGRSGPIMVMIDYVIDQKDVPEFLRLMAMRRNIRRRDGARNWALLRDLEAPERWTESYHIATWDEYVRHNLRRTKADFQNYQDLHRLHRGDSPPQVHRMIERHTVSLDDDVPLLGKLEVP